MRHALFVIEGIVEDWSMASAAKIVGAILLSDCIDGFIFGLCVRWNVLWGVIGTVVFFLFLCGGLMKIWEVSEAKGRMLTNPITSRDQRGIGMVSVFVLLIIGLLFAFLALSI